MDYKEIIKRRSKGATFTLFFWVDKSIKVDIRRVVAQFQFELTHVQVCESFCQYRVVYYGDKLYFGLRCLHLGRELGRITMADMIL